MSPQATPSPGKKLEQYKVTELKDELRRRGLPLSGIKKELIERLRLHINAQESADRTRSSGDNSFQAQSPTGSFHLSSPTIPTSPDYTATSPSFPPTLPDSSTSVQLNFSPMVPDSSPVSPGRVTPPVLPNPVLPAGLASVVPSPVVNPSSVSNTAPGSNITTPSEVSETGVTKINGDSIQHRTEQIISSQLLPSQAEETKAYSEAASKYLDACKEAPIISMSDITMNPEEREVERVVEREVKTEKPISHPESMDTDVESHRLTSPPPPLIEPISEEGKSQTDSQSLKPSVSEPPAIEPEVEGENPNLTNVVVSPSEPSVVTGDNLPEGEIAVPVPLRGVEEENGLTNLKPSVETEMNPNPNSQTPTLPQPESEPTVTSHAESGMEVEGNPNAEAEQGVELQKKGPEFGDGIVSFPETVVVESVTTSGAIKSEENLEEKSEEKPEEKSEEKSEDKSEVKSKLDSENQTEAENRNVIGAQTELKKSEIPVVGATEEEKKPSSNQEQLYSEPVMQDTVMVTGESNDEREGEEVKVSDKREAVEDTVISKSPEEPQHSTVLLSESAGIPQVELENVSSTGVTALTKPSELPELSEPPLAVQAVSEVSEAHTTPAFTEPNSTEPSLGLQTVSKVHDSHLPEDETMAEAVDDGEVVPTSQQDQTTVLQEKQTLEIEPIASGGNADTVFSGGGGVDGGNVIPPEKGNDSKLVETRNEMEVENTDGGLLVQLEAPELELYDVEETEVLKGKEEKEKEKEKGEWQGGLGGKRRRADTQTEVQKEDRDHEIGKRQRRWNSGNSVGVETSGGSFPPQSPSRKTPISRGETTAKAANGLVAHKERIVPPAREPATASVRVDNLLRPFATKHLQELVGRSGKVEHFWIDAIKTHCYVTYSSVEEATAARQALYNLQWPEQGGKLLTVCYVPDEEVATKKAETDGQGDRLSLQALPPAPPLAPSASGQLATSNNLPPPPPPPSRRVLDEEPALPTLDDLFRKTKVRPEIYYLPLTEEQVKAKLAVEQRPTTVKSRG